MWPSQPTPDCKRMAVAPVNLIAPTYIAVSTGLGGGSPRLAPRMLAAELHHPQSGNALYVFALPEKAGQ